MDLLLAIPLSFFAGWLLGRVQATQQHIKRLQSFAAQLQAKMQIAETEREEI